MKLKYYLRGLGIGIIVTAIIMGISIGSHKELTDEEIIKYAEEMGMVKENEVLLPSNATEDDYILNEEQEERTVSDQSVSDQSVSDQSVSEKLVSDDKVVPQPVKAVVEDSRDTKMQDVEHSISQQENDVTVSEKEDTGARIEIQVESGNGSDAVSRKLADAGLIASAVAYDKFLCDNDYDNKIKVGKHTIPAGSSYEEIAGIITSAAE